MSKQLQRGTQKAVAITKNVSQSTISRNIAKKDIPTIVEGLRIEAEKNVLIPKELK